MGPGAAAWAVIGAAVLFSTGGAAIKATSLGGLQVACGRSAIAMVVMLLALPSSRPRREAPWDRRVVAVAAAYAACVTLFVLANKRTTAVNTIFLQSTSPVYVLALSPWLLQEPRRPRDVLVIGVIAAGMGLILSGSSEATAIAADPATGNALAALSGVAWALTVMGLRWLAKQPARRGAAVQAAVLGNLVTAALCAPFTGAWTVGAGDVVVLAWLGVFQIGGAYALLTAALPHLPAMRASLLLFVEPVMAGAWSWLVHGEVPGPRELAGSAVVLVGLLLQALPSRRG